MHKIKVVAGISIAIALTGLFADVDARGVDDGLVAADMWGKRICRA